MFSWIGSFLNRLQSRFTYRQRFIFFSLIYAIAIPYPTYWMLTSENYLINQSRRQIRGIEILGNSTDLAHLLIKQDFIQNYLIENPNEFGSEEKENLLEIQERINSLKKLFQESKTLKWSNLGYGFSKTTNGEVELDEMMQALDTVGKKLSNPKDASVEQKKMIENIPAWFRRQENTFSLDLNLDRLVHQLVLINCELLPQALPLSTAILSLGTKEAGGIETKHIAPTLDTALVLLKNNLADILNRFKKLYRSDQSSPIPPLGYVQASMIDYRTAVENFIAVSLDSSASSFQKFEAFNQVMEKHQKVWRQTQHILSLYFEILLYRQWLEKMICVGFLVIASILVSLFVVLKVLSRHLLAIHTHIGELAQGNFMKCFCSDARDEFGPVGLAFDKMGQAVLKVVSELKNLGKQLTDSITQITSTAKEQEGIVSDQEKSIREIESTAKLIAGNSRDLANTMDELSLSSKHSSLADEAKSGLDGMHGEMSELAAASTNILSTLVAIQEKVASTKSIVAFMGRVSDQAGLLSLNAAIETTNVGQDKRGFTKITQEIQRFAEKTAHSTKEIQHIIKEMSFSVAAVRMDTNNCLIEISEGVQRLVLVNQQLSSITKQGKEQVRKFESVNDVMQVQAFAAENIIESINWLAEAAQENTHYTKILHKTTEELGITAVELQKVLSLFFSKTYKEIEF